MPLPIIYLTDSSSQVWQLGVTDSGAYTTTPVIGSGVPSILFQDAVTSQIWSLSVLMSGALQITATTGVGVANILIYSPSNFLFSFSISNSAISLSLDISVIGGNFQDPLGNPYINGQITFQISQDAFSSSSAISSKNIVTGRLDTNGRIVQPFTIVSNALLTPLTYYKVKVYTVNGQLVWYSPVTIPDTPLVDIGLIVPQY